MGGGRYTDGAAVEVRYPRTPVEEAGPRSVWPWLPGTVLERCGPDECQIRVDAPELAGTDGSPVCYRDAAEIRPTPVRGFRCPCCGDDVMGTPPICGGGCRAAGCGQTRDGTGELDWWDCQREPGYDE